MTNVREDALALHHITALPLDLEDPFYARYTLLKLGVAEGVDFYATRLADVVEDWLARQTEASEWVLTAPAYHAIPAAANLLCADVHALLAGRLPAPAAVSMVELRHERIDAAALGARELQRWEDYSRLGWNERVASRARSDSLTIEDRTFAGRAVLFVNDINVTGAQRRGMAAYFQRVEVARVVWVSVIDVDEAVGRREPQLEFALNTSRRLSVKELAEVLTRPGTRFTSKCMGRIFAFEPEEMERFLTALGANLRATVLRLALAEGRFDGTDCAEKMALLRAACARDGLAATR
ncbi:MAG TPA: phosphoribosyltransferase family protein [Thermoanaerobaculia bacterium]|nr:phosphoribosyltransferase family protein [Thermoanaerobaculia bacterium]